MRKKPDLERIALGLDPDPDNPQERKMRQALGLDTDPQSKAAKEQRRIRIALGLSPEAPQDDDEEKGES